MNEKAKAAQAAYMREYRRKNKEKIAEIQRRWARANPDKMKAARERYWERKAEENALEDNGL